MASKLQARVALFALAAILGIAGCAAAVENVILLSKLPKTLVVTATMPGGGPITEVKTGQDTIVVKWSVNTTGLAPGGDAAYRKVRTKLCFGKESTILRGWRKPNDIIKKDKMCLYNIALVPYTAAGASYDYKLPKSIPGAKYYVRAYALDANGNQVAYGENSADRATNLFTVIPITGRHASIDIAVGVFSVFSVGSLFTFFILERIYLKRKKSV